MTAQAQIVADDAHEFFAPTSTDMIDGLIGAYKAERVKIEAVHDFLSSADYSGAVGYYMSGNREHFVGLRFLPATETMFKLEGALAALNANHWRKALDQTDVLDFMPAKRREEWFEQIEKMNTPDFEEETVRATLGGLLAQRMNFLAEKVDGIFQSLSREHVTNRPEGFSKRMILQGVTTDWGGYGRQKAGTVNDLRQIIAKFMGRDEPQFNATNDLVQKARDHFRGEWLDVDGGALRIRCYLNGNGHLEVHPDMAWRLNQILAYLYPSAIPSQYREAPKRKAKAKEHQLMERPLPFAVIELLRKMRSVRTTGGTGWRGKTFEPKTTNPHSLEFDYGEKDKHALAEAERVLSAIGGAKYGEGLSSWWEFDYHPSEVINLVCISGCIPDQKSHQFYPTPESLAKKVIELASEGATPKMHWLEPNAGTGGLADHVPEDAFLECYEISKLHCEVLKAKGYTQAGRKAITCLDFLQLANDYRGGGYNRVVMNPPFDQGRWLAHIEAAASVTAKNARIVAVLPEGAAKRLQLPGFALQWHGPYSNEFAGTSISVVIVVADKQ
ncbi:DUF4942 domain-containing protein [Vreelandella venusta]|uniref:DUF4942 domain-containing protein n=1 Tax=Vreelandella venusta TaxID=44935 RepID=UPI003F677871